MKTIAIIACCDTKHSEIYFLYERIRRGGCEPLVIDVSTSPDFRSPAEITREQVAAEIGVAWSDLATSPKHELLETVRRGVTALVPRLYRQGKIHGVISLGGLQNTVVGSSAMRALPIGVPKVMVSTVATGQRPFDLIVGTKDVTVIPAICDIAGLNVISETVLGNAAGAILGMLTHAGRELPQITGDIVGTTLMGATNDGVVQATASLERKGHKVISFHSTGIGGKVMEELITAGTITAAMDMTLHEIVYEHFGHGFGFGAENRLIAGIEKEIPMVVVPGGIDFICQWRNELFEDASSRKMIWHNSDLAHVKLNVAEATDISRLIVARLNTAKPGNVVVLLPLEGLRTYAKAGEPLHDPDVDGAIFDVFRTELRPDIELRAVDLSIVDEEFSEIVASEMDTLMRRMKCRPRKGERAHG